MAARMNAPYFYTWLRDKEIKDPETKALLQIQGLSGDSHFLNYSDWMTAKGKRIIRLSDPDDHGAGPFFAEIIRFSTVALSSKYDLTAPELVEAYLRGLSGKPARPTKEVAAVEKMTPEESISKQQKFVQGLFAFENNTYAFTKKAKSTEISKAPPDLQTYYAEIRPMLLDWLKKNQYDMLLEGYRVKKDGGSAGYPRFHYLVVDSKKQIKFIEFKYQPIKPAVGFYQADQAPFGQRLSVIKTTWIGEPLGSVIDSVEVQYRGAISQFYIREVFKSAFDLEDLEDSAAIKKNILYLAQQLGFWASVYQRATVREINKTALNQKNKSKTREKLIRLIEEFQQARPKNNL